MRGTQTLPLRQLLNQRSVVLVFELYHAYNYYSLYVTARCYKADCIYKVSIVITVTTHTVIKFRLKLLHRCNSKKHSKDANNKHVQYFSRHSSKAINIGNLNQKA
jgi:hypothetical protein